MHIKRLHIPLIFILLILQTSLHAQSHDELVRNFKNPPESAWPRTWWHWTKSNVSKEGITKDLEWMKRVGIAGFQLADVAAGSGQEVDSKIVFGSKEWLDAVRHTASEAERLDLEMAMFSSAGWSLTGGPWVKPEEAMKKLVWSETFVNADGPIRTQLPKPPSPIGPGPSSAASNVQDNFYRDFSVIAFRTPEDEIRTQQQRPTLTSSGSTSGADLLLDNDISTIFNVKPEKDGQNAWIQLNYPDIISARAITINAGRRGIPFGKVLASTDGKNFKTLTTLPGKSGYRGGNIRTYTFPQINAKYIRIEFTNAPPRPADVVSEATTTRDTAYTIADIKIHSGGRVNRWEDKAGFNLLFEYSGVSTPELPSTALIKRTDIIDLTGKMSANGQLNWNAPKGKWTIMRFGYALTGAKNRPAVPSGLGYEVDKLSRKHTESYLRGYTEPIAKALGDLYGKRLLYIMLDSWEAGIQNWTDEMISEFKQRRGYDPSPFLPVLAGRVVGSSEVSDRFLWDFRRTLVDMFAENHYGVVSDFFHKQGIKTYGEAGGVSLESIEDALLNKKYMDIPMGEFWVKDLHPSSMYYEDVRGAASSSHVYGKNLVAAEAFTGGNYESPNTLKKIGDYWFTQGINRLVFHTSAHQPLDTKPGNTMVGTHLHRNITWAELAKPLMTHFARNSYMLQRGLFVADVAYLLTEGAPSTMPFWQSGLQPSMPPGYDFDYINTDVLLNRMQVSPSGKLVLPDAMTYSVLVLPQTSEMTLHALKKIEQLISGGATVIGPKPIAASGLSGYPQVDADLHELASNIWGDLDGVSRTVRTYGKGKIVWGQSVKQVLKALNVNPDLSLNGTTDEVSWIHRKDGETDIYFVVNRTDSPLNLSARFRIGGRKPELWYPDSGSVQPAAYQINDSLTNVPLNLAGGQSVFVVFNERTDITAFKTPQESSVTLAILGGGWEISFPANSGAPEKLQIAELKSLTHQADSGVKYFSGTATYTKNIEVKKNWLRPNQKLLLDLGTVRDLAEVYINGNKVDLLWKSPFTVDVSKHLKAGRNQLAIKVTNQWTNRLIGDKANPQTKVLDAYTAPFGAPYQLTESGLIGPIKLLAIERSKNL